jgi:hypothetical protein
VVHAVTASTSGFTGGVATTTGRAAATGEDAVTDTTGGVVTLVDSRRVGDELGTAMGVTADGDVTDAVLAGTGTATAGGVTIFAGDVVTVDDDDGLERVVVAVVVTATAATAGALAIGVLDTLAGDESMDLRFLADYYMDIQT